MSEHTYVIRGRFHHQAGVLVGAGVAHDPRPVVREDGTTTAEATGGKPRVVLVTADRLGGEALVIACRRRGIAIEAMAPDALRDAVPDILILDARTLEPDRTEAAALEGDDVGRVVVLADATDVVTLPAAVRVPTSGDLDDLVAAIIGRGAPIRPPADPKDPVGLTARESEVLRALVAGWGTATMAERLCISQRTVGTHLRNIYTKLGVRNRTEAAAWAAAAGFASAETTDGHFDELP